jgi:uncharacterized DUF497 family protein
MNFEWDEAKSKRTEAARGLTFDYAAAVFLDPYRISAEARETDGEIRHYVIGQAPFGEILFVVYTWRHYEEEKVCRMISARPARKKERERYSQVR